MKWVAIKTVTRENGSIIVGCSVGPFGTEERAKCYAERASTGSLGYEKWIVQELQTPSEL